MESDVEPGFTLARREVFEAAIQLAMQNGGPVDEWVESIMRAVKLVNKAQPELGR